MYLSSNLPRIHGLDADDAGGNHGGHVGASLDEGPRSKHVVAIRHLSSKKRIVQKENRTDEKKVFDHVNGLLNIDTGRPKDAHTDDHEELEGNDSMTRKAARAGSIVVVVAPGLRRVERRKSRNGRSISGLRVALAEP